MEYQNMGRQQRSKGANMKQALLVMMLVAGCSWLIYQINNSRHKPENNYGDPHRPVGQYWAVSLGRKGTPSWLFEIQFPTLGKEHISEPKIAFINDSQSNEKEAEGQIRMNTQPDGSIKQDEEVEEHKTIANGVWFHTFDDENGVPPGVNETETLGGVAQIDIVHAEETNISDDDSKENDIVEVTFGGLTSVVVDAVDSQSIIAHADS